MRANDLIWSSVVNHYLLDRAAPPSDLLYWFEDGARIPAAFLKSYNRDLLLENKLKEPAGFKVGDVAIDLAAITTPMLVIALKDDHVSAWEAVYAGRAPPRRRLRPRRLGPQCRDRQSAGREQARLLDQRRPAGRRRRSGSPRRRGTKAAGGRGGPNGSASMASGKTVAGAQAEGPDRAGARPLRDDAVMDAMTTAQDVITEKQGLAGRLRLNRPKALHSLNRQMVRDMAQRADRMARRSRRPHHPHRPCRRPRLLRRRRRRRHQPGRRGP